MSHHHDTCRAYVHHSRTLQLASAISTVMFSLICFACFCCCWFTCSIFIFWNWFCIFLILIMSVMIQTWTERYHEDSGLVCLIVSIGINFIIKYLSSLLLQHAIIRYICLLMIYRITMPVWFQQSYFGYWQVWWTQPPTLGVVYHRSPSTSYPSAWCGML